MFGNFYEMLEECGSCFAVYEAMLLFFNEILVFLFF